MLFLCNTVTNFHKFRELFHKTYEGKHSIDLSKVSVSELADQSDSVLNHHKECAIFLGYLEPGWMLENTAQTRMRKLFRKFDVWLVTEYVDSLPFAWKSEIETVFQFHENEKK